ncbi:unnamed protein product [Fraxinus pennsylvanica]|uniref:26S proteasome non-ATPase regulatory subunit 3 N-terminal TPR repeats domain-containing protein n=1 Tax=Fraxinus pennsylvanica TaxID=56036 RepID=A0AAD1ZFA5_9LAMI|nr:unnamed protein product [Fraxinus pennsylvanica]
MLIVNEKIGYESSKEIDRQILDLTLDTATSATQAPEKHPLPELEVYCCSLVLIFLIDQKRYSEAKACSSASIARPKNLNRRTVDVPASRLYFYCSLSYELTGDLAEIRCNKLKLKAVNDGSASYSASERTYSSSLCSFQIHFVPNSVNLL